MPKSPPDQVIIHRIEFQESERRLLEQVATAYSFRNVSRGIFNLTSDATTVVILLVGLEMLTGKELITDGLMAALGAAGGGVNALALAVAEGFKGWFLSRQAVQDADAAYTEYAEGIEDFWDRLFSSFAEFRSKFLSGSPGGGGGGGTF